MASNPPFKRPSITPNQRAYSSGLRSHTQEILTQLLASPSVYYATSPSSDDGSTDDFFSTLTPALQAQRDKEHERGFDLSPERSTENVQHESSSYSESEEESSSDEEDEGRPVQIEFLRNSKRNRSNFEGVTARSVVALAVFDDDEEEGDVATTPRAHPRDLKTDDVLQPPGESSFRTGTDPVEGVTNALNQATIAW